MRRFLITIFAALMTISLTACGGTSSSSNGGQEESASKAVSIKSDFKFMSDFVSALQGVGVPCADFEKKAEPSILAKDEGSCSHNGATLYLVLFADPKTTPELVNSLKSFGGYFLTSNNWAINVEDEATAKDLQEKLGVEVL